MGIKAWCLPLLSFHLKKAIKNGWKILYSLPEKLHLLSRYSNFCALFLSSFSFILAIAKLIRENARWEILKFMTSSCVLLHKKWSYPLRISSVNVTKSASLQIWSHLLKKSLMENFIFCAVSFRRNVVLSNGRWNLQQCLTLCFLFHPNSLSWNTFTWLFCVIYTGKSIINWTGGNTVWNKCK